MTFEIRAKYLELACVSWPYGDASKHQTEYFHYDELDVDLWATPEIQVWIAQNAARAMAFRVYNSTTGAYRFYDRFFIEIHRDDAYSLSPESFEIQGTVTMYFADGRPGFRAMTTLAGAEYVMYAMMLSIIWDDTCYFVPDFSLWENSIHSDYLTWRSCSCTTCRDLRGE